MESGDERIDVIEEYGLVKVISKEIINVLTMLYNSDDKLDHLLT